MSDTPIQGSITVDKYSHLPIDVQHIVRELERENAALRKALSDADVVAEYSRDDGHREWWSGGYWLHRNEVLVCMDRAAFDAARKEAQP